MYSSDLFDSLQRTDRQSHSRIPTCALLILEMGMPGDSKKQQQRRREILLELGEHVQSVLKRKREMRDGHLGPKWWKEELWRYISANLPTGGKIMHWEQTVAIYEKYKRRAKKKRIREAQSARETQA